MDRFFSLEKPFFGIFSAAFFGGIYIIASEIIQFKLVDYELFFLMVVGFIFGNLIRIKYTKGTK